jgi:hypothetical protein
MVEEARSCNPLQDKTLDLSISEPFYPRPCNLILAPHPACAYRRLTMAM